MFEFSLQPFHTAPLALDDIFDVCDAVKIDLELVHLSHDVLKPRNLRIGIIDEVPGTIVLLEGDNGTLLAEVLDPLLDLLHQTIEMP